MDFAEMETATPERTLFSLGRLVGVNDAFQMKGAAISETGRGWHVSNQKRSFFRMFGKLKTICNTMKINGYYFWNFSLRVRRLYGRLILVAKDQRVMGLNRTFGG